MSAIQEAMKKARTEKETGMRGLREILPREAPPTFPRRRRVGKKWIVAGCLLLMGAGGGIAYHRGWLGTNPIANLQEMLGLSDGPPAVPAAPGPAGGIAKSREAPARGGQPGSAQNVQAARSPQTGERASPPGQPPGASAGGSGTAPPATASRKAPSGPNPAAPSPRPAPVSPSASAVPGTGQSPSSPSPARGLQEAKRLQAAGDAAGAEAILKEMVAKTPAETDALIALANLYMGPLQSPPKAFPLYQQALQQAPHRASLHVNLGVYHLRTGDRNQALIHLNRAIGLDPRIPEAHYNLACLHALQGDRQAAERALEKAKQLDPRSADWAKDDPDLALLRTPPASNAAPAAGEVGRPPAQSPPGASPPARPGRGPRREAAGR